MLLFHCRASLSYRKQNFLSIKDVRRHAHEKLPHLSQPTRAAVHLIPCTCKTTDTYSAEEAKSIFMCLKEINNQLSCNLASLNIGTVVFSLHNIQFGIRQTVCNQFRMLQLNYIFVSSQCQNRNVNIFQGFRIVLAFRHKVSHFSGLSSNHGNKTWKSHQAGKEALAQLNRYAALLAEIQELYPQIGITLAKGILTSRKKKIQVSVFASNFSFR